MKKLILLILIYFICINIHAQSWRPVFSLPMGAELLQNINNQNLNEYLDRNISWRHPGNCEAKMSVFYFRVTSQGKIDSIRIEGNLKKDVSSQIVKNIYQTEGKWKMPKDSRVSDKCWFVYPFFLFGNSGPCSDSAKVIYRQLYSLYQTYEYSSDFQDRTGRVIISPNRFAKLSEK